MASDTTRTNRMARTGPHAQLREPSLDMTPGRGAPPTMVGPRPYLLRMAFFLIALAAGLAALGYFKFDFLVTAFNNNAVLNGAILAVFVLGVGFVLREVQLLGHDAAWINHYPHVQGIARSPKLLVPLATVLSGRRGRARISPSMARSLLDGVASRQGETREIARYIVGLLIFLGLLGTFWGLLGTVNAVGAVIGQLNPQSGDLSILFGDLTEGLRAPLDGMGTAFSTSLFGLATSLLLGFLDLQGGQAQNRFYNDLEDWLGAHTGEGDALESLGSTQATGNVPAYINALLRKSAESLDDMRSTMADQADAHLKTNQVVASLSGHLTALVDQMRVEQDLLIRLAETQVAATPNGAMDEATRNHIRNTDVHLGRLVEELANSRERLIVELRDEIRLVARTVAVAAEHEEHAGEPRDAGERMGRARLRRAR